VHSQKLYSFAVFSSLLLTAPWLLSDKPLAALDVSTIGVALPPTDYSHLNQALESAAASAQLVTTPAFIDKAQQLYEMILVRHGLMLVGCSYGAKTSIYRCASSPEPS